MLRIYFKSVLLLISLFYLTSCQTQYMTQEEFASIPIGAPISSVQDIAGTPYEIVHEADGSENHRYIERIEIGPNQVDQVVYSLHVVDGNVIHKHCSSTSKTVNFKVD